ncbi:kynureninase isoform X2 [Dermatophagoides farinae]
MDVKTKCKQKIKEIQSKSRINPVAILQKNAHEWNVSIESAEFARLMDKHDPLCSFRQMFTFPKKADLPNIDKINLKDPEEECIYLCGQSLGLKPKLLDQNVQKVLDNWANKGVHSHFHGYLPAALSDLPAKKLMARMVGAQENEIAILNGLTVNLHLLLATFYRPDSNRYKLMIEDHAFPSDTYVAKSQLRSHGISPEKGLILLKPRKGENLLNEDDIIRLFDEQGDQIKVALLPAVQYYTGQLLNVKRLTEAAQKRGILVGVDLAHAVGNVPIYLDDWNVDFAAWCTYKYMNAGAGSMAGIYVNEKYFANYSKTFPMYQGWWGNNVQTKFLMKGDFDPALGADMFKLSNPSPVLNAMLMTSLEIFEQTSMEELRQKEYILTGYLEFMIKSFFPQTDKRHTHQQQESTNNDGDNRSLLIPSIQIITPSDPEQRGAQLSLIFSVPLSIIHEQFQKRGIVCDIRMPSVMRVAPTPLYNSFTDVYRFITTLYDIFQNMDSLSISHTDDDLSIMTKETGGVINNEISDDGQGSSISGSDSEADSLGGSTNTL